MLPTIVFDAKPCDREAFQNVLITEHPALLTNEALGEIARVTIASLIALATGQPFLPDTALT